MPTKQLVHALASSQHDIWARWMQWMFKQGTFNQDGTWTMPALKVERWQRQAATDYGDLPEHERASDIEIALEIVAIIEGNDVTA